MLGVMTRRCECLLLATLLSLAGCDGERPADAGGAHDAGASDAGSSADAGARDGGPSPDAGGVDGGPATDAGVADAGDPDAGPSDAGPPDAGPGDAGPPDAGPPTGPMTFDVRVLADGFCDELRFDPPSIAVPAGTELTVNWINATGCTEIDIDMGGTVPIVIGLESGSSYHDMIRRWCGTYTGTYTFRAYYAPSYPFTMLADCDA